MVSSSLAIREISVISPVGWGFDDSCASIRAGITRPTGIDDFPVLDPNTQDLVPVTGYKMPIGGQGFDMIGKWMSLSIESMRELISRLRPDCEVDSEFWKSSLFIAVCPRLAPDRLQTDTEQDITVLIDRYLVPLLVQAQLDVPRNNLRVIATGQSGVFTALENASTELEAGRFKRAIIIVVDSYLDSLSLEWLSRYGRLKSDENAAGLVPGEASVTFCLELAGNAASGRQIAIVDRVVVKDDVDQFFAEGPRNGEAMSHVLNEVLDVDSSGVFEGDVVTDQNGEHWRAWEFACARTRVAALQSENVRVVLPAVSVGEVGAASGAVSIACAAASLQRGYASTSRALVLSSSEFGAAAAAILSGAV